MVSYKALNTYIEELKNAVKYAMQPPVMMKHF